MATQPVTPRLALAPAHVITGRVARRIGLVVAQIGLVLFIVWQWQRLADARAINTFVVGEPRRIWSFLRHWVDQGVLLPNLLVTLGAVAIGYLIALVVGTGAGLATGLWPRFGRLVDPFISFAIGFPSLIFYPFFGLIIGFNMSSRAVHVAFVVVFVIAAQTAAGVRHIDPVLLRNVKALGAGRWQLVTQAYLPATAVWIMTSARTMFGIALRAAIVAEFVGAQSGLGRLILTGQDQFDVNQVWAATLIVIVVAVVLDLGLGALQRRFTAWAPKTGP